MQTSEQVAGEAREKLADKIESKRFSWSDGLWFRPALQAEDWDLIVAALRAQPERGAEEMRERAARCAETIEAWCEYVNIGESSKDGIAKAIRALPLHPAKDEGGGHG